MGGKVGFIVMLVAYVVFVSIVGAGIGLMAEGEFQQHSELQDASTWSYLLGGVTFLFQLLIFQAQGVPPVVNALFVFPFMSGLLYLIIRIIRGGG